MTLAQVWHDMKHITGWIGLLEDSGVFTDSELRELEKLDDESVQYVDKNIYREIEHAFAEQRREFEFGLLEIETDEGKVKALSKHIAEKWEALGEKMSRVPFWLTELEAREIKRIEKYRNKIQARLVHTRQPDSKSLTEWELHKARTYPLENLISVGRDGRILCEWHEDTKPSMMVRNGWGYCFSCGKSVDSIRWLMEVKGMSFQEAVKNLSGRIG